MRNRIGLAVVCVLSMYAASGAQDKKDDKAITVSALKFVPKDPTVAFTIGGQSKVVTLSDAAAVEKLVGKADAKSLVDAVDFKKEAIVLVSWFTGGPPDGTLKHETKAGKLQFYVQGPPGKGARGERARIGADFFAVPAGLKVKFDPKER